MKLCNEDGEMKYVIDSFGLWNVLFLEKNIFSLLESISGYIPVAPVGTGSYSKEFYLSVRVPTMVSMNQSENAKESMTEKIYIFTAFL
jgi:hypothetical protein